MSYEDDFERVMIAAEYQNCITKRMEIQAILDKCSCDSRCFKKLSPLASPAQPETDKEQLKAEGWVKVADIPKDFLVHKCDCSDKCNDPSMAQCPDRFSHQHSRSCEHFCETIREARCVPLKPLQFISRLP